MVYNLSIDPPDSLASENVQGGPFGSPQNHKHIHHPDMACPFPFPKGFFTAVVFRFPPISSEANYRFAVAECKRVLRPGGYLEISCLDMDMLNMGNLGRRAIRGLKEKLHAEDPTISLKPISDSLQRLVARRGFEKLSRCFVGVPAAGCIPSSTEGSGISSGPTSPTKESFTKQIRSFGDMLRDTSPAGEANITQMVARVARWWYTRCYETGVLSAGSDQSIWTDQALIKECEARGTSLRLMVCFAQKPECAVRRTISAPV
jgi:SAM-dependent methyltransferase